MPVTSSVTRGLIPQKQRLRDLQDGVLAMQGQMRIAKGIQVIRCCTCGHRECGDPPPLSLPDDAWIVVQGCHFQAPEQATSQSIKEATGRGPEELSAQQQKDLEELLALARNSDLSPSPTPSTHFGAIRR